MEIRCTDESSFFAISDRFDINRLDVNEQNLLKLPNDTVNLFRGDCYICKFR